MLIGQRLYQGSVLDERGHRYPVPFYLDDVQDVFKDTSDDGSVRAYANLRGSKGRNPMRVEVDARTMQEITFGKAKL